MENVSSMTPAERAELIGRLAQLGLLRTSPKFRVKRFYLDTALNRSMVTTSMPNAFGGVIKSFWVCDWSGNFNANFVANHGVDRDLDSGIPLRKNQCLKFNIPAADACIEFDAQPGAWIDIAYSDTEDIDVGSIVAEVTAATTIREGTSFQNSRIQVDATGVIVCVASGSRGKATIRNCSMTEPLYLGSLADMSDVNFKELCAMVIKPGERDYWRNTAQLYARVETGTAYAAVMEEAV